MRTGSDQRRGHSKREWLRELFDFVARFGSISAHAVTALATVRVAPMAMTRRKASTNEWPIALSSAARICGAISSGDGRAGQLGALAVKRALERRRQIQRRQTRVERAVEALQHHDSEHRDREQTSSSRSGIVDSGRDACARLRNGVHDGRRQRRDADRHPDSEHDHGRKKCSPISAANAWEDEECKPGRGDERAENERRPGAVALHESAGPARQEKDDEDQWQQRSARSVGVYRCT